jgi:hypothetical protein
MIRRDPVLISAVTAKVDLLVLDLHLRAVDRNSCRIGQFLPFGLAAGGVSRPCKAAAGGECRLRSRPSQAHLRAAHAAGLRSARGFPKLAIMCGITGIFRKGRFGA